MSHRRPDPRQAGLEQALRHALRLAVDPVEPAADGLDRIRSKIEARPHAARTGWWATYLPGLLAVLGTAWRFGESAAIWLRYWTGAIAERFRPDLGRVGWLGWLRPAAAAATVLLVATGASWAVTALPRMISNAGDSHNVGGRGPNSSAPPSAQHSSPAGGGPASSGPGYSSSAPTSPSCSATPPTPSASASGSPSQSPSPPPSTSSSPSPTPTPSTSTSTTPSGSPSPSSSPTGSPSTNSPVSAQAIHSVAPLVGRTSQPRPELSTPKTGANPSKPASGKRSPC